MTLDRTLLAAKVVAVERHLDRVAARLPSEAKDLTPASDASDAVILHLWQAVQIAVDVAVALCLRLKLETPAGYGDALGSSREAASWTWPWPNGWRGPRASAM